LEKIVTRDGFTVFTVVASGIKIRHIDDKNNIYALCLLWDRRCAILSFCRNHYVIRKLLGSTFNMFPAYGNLASQ
jgi:hypothetical protein